MPTIPKAQLNKYLQKYLGSFAVKYGLKVKDDLIYRIENKMLIGIHFDRGSNKDIRPKAIVMPLFMKFDALVLSYSAELRQFIQCKEWFQTDNDLEQLFKELSTNFETYFIPWLEERNMPDKLLSKDPQLDSYGVNYIKFLCAIETGDLILAEKFAELIYDVALKFNKASEIDQLIDLLKADSRQAQSILAKNMEFTLVKLGLNY